MANPYHKLFNLLAFVLLAGALYINFGRSTEAPAGRSKTNLSTKAINPQQQDNKVFLAKTEEKK